MVGDEVFSFIQGDHINFVHKLCCIGHLTTVDGEVITKQSSPKVVQRELGLNTSESLKCIWFIQSKT